ncbi:MAG: nucleoside triphosphate pyrophosphatase [bacterium]
MKIILGSSSAGRRSVLQKAGYNFEVMAADIDEKAIRKENPEELVMAIANAKADALLPQVKEPSILITSDQVILYKENVREKPVGEEQATEFLRSYSEAPAVTLGATVVINTETGKRVSGLQRTTVYFKPMPENFIKEYIASGQPFKGAGGFVIQDEVLAPYIDHIEGRIDSAAGLSMELLEKLIAEVSEVKSQEFNG